MFILRRCTLPCITFPYTTVSSSEIPPPTTATSGRRTATSVRPFILPFFPADVYIVMTPVLLQFPLPVAYVSYVSFYGSNSVTRFFIYKKLIQGRRAIKVSQIFDLSRAKNFLSVSQSSENPVILAPNSKKISKFRISYRKSFQEERMKPFSFSTFWALQPRFLIRIKTCRFSLHKNWNS